MQPFCCLGFLKTLIFLKSQIHLLLLLLAPSLQDNRFFLIMLQDINHELNPLSALRDPASCASWRCQLHPASFPARRRPHLSVLRGNAFSLGQLPLLIPFLGFFSVTVLSRHRMPSDSCSRFLLKGKSRNSVDEFVCRKC